MINLWSRCWRHRENVNVFHWVNIQNQPALFSKKHNTMWIWKCQEYINVCSSNAAVKLHYLKCSLTIAASGLKIHGKPIFRGQVQLSQAMHCFTLWLTLDIISTSHTQISGRAKFCCLNQCWIQYKDLDCPVVTLSCIKRPKDSIIMMKKVKDWAFLLWMCKVIEFSFKGKNNKNDLVRIYSRPTVNTSRSRRINCVLPIYLNCSAVRWFFIVTYA